MNCYTFNIRINGLKPFKNGSHLNSFSIIINYFQFLSIISSIFFDNLLIGIEFGIN